MHNVTLQFNLSQGDTPFARQSIPSLVEAHRKNVDEIIAIVDCCRPQRTRMIDQDHLFSESEYNQRLKGICAIAEELKNKGYLDRIIYLRPDDTILAVLSRKYLRNIIHETHDYRGAPIMSYLLAWEVCATRYLLHYDADMLLYQALGYDWSVEARRLMDKEPKAIAATPRVSPPFSKEKGIPDCPSLEKGGILALPVEGGWRIIWFSARCILIDLNKLHSYLPLIKGRYLIEVLLRKYLNRSYPPALEMMLFRRALQIGGWRFDLKSEQAWLLHPEDKSLRYLELLPRIERAILQGKVPLEQRGYENVKFSIWEDFLANT